MESETIIIFILADALRKLLEIKAVSSTASKANNCLAGYFSMYEFSQMTVSDNGPQFTLVTFYY